MKNTQYGRFTFLLSSALTIWHFLLPEYLASWMLKYLAMKAYLKKKVKIGTGEMAQLIKMLVQQA